MRLLADENIPIQAIEMLRKKGHDVLAISESAPSICDENVMLLAEGEGRILLTFDLKMRSLLHVLQGPLARVCRRPQARGREPGGQMQGSYDSGRCDLDEPGVI